MLGVPPFLVYHDVDNKHTLWTTPSAKRVYSPAWRLQPKVRINITNKQDRWANEEVVTDTLLQSRLFEKEVVRQSYTALSCHLTFIQLAQGWKLSWHHAFTLLSPKVPRSSIISSLSGDKNEALWLLCHRTASLSTRVASLLSIHMYSPLPTMGLSSENRLNCWEERWFHPQNESQSIRTETQVLSRLLLISQNSWQDLHSGAFFLMADGPSCLSLFLWYDDQSQGGTSEDFKRGKKQQHLPNSYI